MRHIATTSLEQSYLKGWRKVWNLKIALFFVLCRDPKFCFKKITDAILMLPSLYVQYAVRLPFTLL